MKPIAAIGVLVVALALQACNPAEEQTSNTAPAADSTAAPGAMGNMPMPAPTQEASQGTTYTTMGEVASVAADSVTINHEPVPALGWPSMTMTFRAPDPAMVSGLTTGMPVQFSFRQEGSQNVLTDISPR
jgi:Cu(I)/Ag(I) efflux system membrane fusion protein